MGDAAARPALWGPIELETSNGERHYAVVVRQGASGRYWVCSETLGGVVDSNTFARIGLRVRELHPELGTRATVHTGDTAGLQCVVAAQLRPAPHVRLHAEKVDETYDTRTFARLQIHLSYAVCESVVALIDAPLNTAANGARLDEEVGSEEGKNGTSSEGAESEMTAAKKEDVEAGEEKKTRTSHEIEEEEVMASGDEGRKRRRVSRVLEQRDGRSRKITPRQMIQRCEYRALGGGVLYQCPFLHCGTEGFTKAEQILQHMGTHKEHKIELRSARKMVNWAGFIDFAAKNPHLVEPYARRSS